MTVTQMERKFVVIEKDNKRFNRLEINKEFAKQILKHYFAVSANRKATDTDKQNAFAESVQIVNNRFCNLYGAQAQKEWSTFYASVVLPLKIGLGLTLPHIKTDGMVNKYSDITDKERKAILSCGVCRLKLTKKVLASHLRVFPFSQPVNKESSVDDFCKKEYFDGDCTDGELKDAVNDLWKIHTSISENCKIVQDAIDRNNGVLTIPQK